MASHFLKPSNLQPYSTDEYAIQLSPIAVLHMPHFRQGDSDTDDIRNGAPAKAYHIRQLEEEVEATESRNEVSGGRLDRRQPTNLRSSFVSPLTSAPSEVEEDPVQPPSRSSSGVTLTFVNIHTSSGRRDKVAESAIRSHAMQQVHRLRRLTKNKTQRRVYANSSPRTKQPCSCVKKFDEKSPATGLRGGSSEIPPTLRCLQHFGSQTCHLTRRAESACRFPFSPAGDIRCKQCGHYQTTTGSSLKDMDTINWSNSPRDLGAGLYDPFNQTSTPITARMHEFVYHWLHIFNPTTNPEIYGKDDLALLLKSLVPMILADAGTLHSVCAVAGYHQIFLHTQQSKKYTRSSSTFAFQQRRAESAYHVSEAVKLISKRVAWNKDTLSIETIITVGLLTVSTALAGDIGQLSAHHDGLVKLVQCRGGINTLPRDVATSVSRTDSNGAWMKEVQPGLPMYDSAARTSNRPLGSPFEMARIQAFLWAPLFSLAVDLYSLSYLLEVASRSGNRIVEPKEVEFFEDTYAAAQHMLADFPHPRAVLVKSTMYYRQNCWRCAAFIYFNTAIRTSPSGGLLNSATQRLFTSLQESDLSMDWAPYPDMLLWVLFMGAVGALVPAEKRWLALMFQRVARDLGLFTIQQVEDLLRMQLYRAVKLRGPLKELMESDYSTLDDLA